MLILIACRIALACFAAVCLLRPLQAQDVSFSNQIRPILATKCAGCHQPEMRSGGLLLGSHAEFMRGGRHGSPIVPGDPESSLVIKHLTGVIEPRMPMGGEPLAEADLELFRQWIRQQARDDSGADVDPIPGEPPVYQASPVITALAFSTDGEKLAVSGNHEILLHRADGSGIVGRLVGRSERIHSIAFSPDGQTLVAVGGSAARFGEVQFWDVQGAKMRCGVKIGNDTLFGASFSPDGKYAAFGCPDKSIRIYDPLTCREIRKMETHSDWVFGTVFSVDSRRLVSVSRDHFVKLSEAATGAFLENLNLLTKATFGGQGEIYALARHPKSDLVIIGGDDRRPRMYTMNRPRAMKIDDDSCLVREFEPQGGPVQAVAFSPDGMSVAVAGMGDAVNVYRVETGARAASLTGHKGGIYSLAFHPSGNQLAAAGFDGIVRVYDLGNQSLLKDFVPVPVSSVKQSSNARIDDPRGLP